MNTAPTAAARAAAAPPSERPFYYTCIPDLGPLRPGGPTAVLLPATGGLPGVTYLQCALENLRRAQDEGWGEVSGGSHVYTIANPERGAEIDMKLLCRGKPLWGRDLHSSRRECLVDQLVEERTGLRIDRAAAAPEAEPEQDTAAPPRSAPGRTKRPGG